MVFGVLVVVLRLDRISRQGCTASERQLALVVPPRVLIAPRAGRLAPDVHLAERAAGWRVFLIFFCRFCMFTPWEQRVECFRGTQDENSTLYIHSQKKTGAPSRPLSPDDLLGELPIGREGSNRRFRI